MQARLVHRTVAEGQQHGQDPGKGHGRHTAHDGRQHPRPVFLLPWRQAEPLPPDQQGEHTALDQVVDRNDADESIERPGMAGVMIHRVDQGLVERVQGGSRVSRPETTRTARPPQ